MNKRLQYATGKRLKRVTRKRLKGGIYRIRNLHELHAFDIHPTHPIHDTFLCNNKQHSELQVLA